MVLRNEHPNHKGTEDILTAEDGNEGDRKSSEVEVHLISPGETNAAGLVSFGDQKLGEEEEESPGSKSVTESAQPFLYGVYENPPLPWTILFAFQQAMASIAAPMVYGNIVCDVVCGQEDDTLRLQILSATMFMTGLASFAMCSVGVRLPLYQGPSAVYLVPLLSMKTMDEWKCPRTFKALDPTTNTTILMADMGNGTFIPNRELSLDKISVLSGSLVAAGVVHFLIGLSGLVGIFTRYIGPVTIVPTITLVGLQLHKVYVRFSQFDWTTSVVVTAFCMTLSLYMSNFKTPVPKWNKRRGFYIEWKPVHQVLSILFTLIFGCILSTILTAANFYSDDPENKNYMARMNARSSIISEANWFIFPYPGKFGPLSFSTGIFLSFLVATLSSVIDSIGDYTACARIVQVSPPPPYAFNRGLFVEGLMGTLSGFVGCCHATVSYGMNLGALKVTKVTSLRVLQGTGLIYIVFAIFGKLGAVFVSIPFPILGGILLVLLGMFIGMVISCLQSIDLNSTRNVAIIGMTLLVGFATPHWVKTNPDGVNTGRKDFDEIIRMLLSNPTFVSAIFAAFLDNTIPGSLRERGLLHQMEDFKGEGKDDMPRTQHGTKIYRLPFLPDAFRRSCITKYVPMFDETVADPK